MKKTLITSPIVVAALILVGATQLMHAEGTTSADFLKMGAGARAAAMGDAFSAVSNDVSASYWNPAGLAQIDAPQASFMHNSGLVGSQYQYLAAAVPCTNQVLAFSLYRLDYGTIDGYSAADVKQGSFDAGSMALSASIGKKMTDSLSIGASVKVLQEKLESEKASGAAADLGALWTLDKTNLSAVVQHLGTPMKFVQEKSALPMTISLGASRKFFDDRLLASADISQAKGSELALKGGVEYALTPTVALRSGYHVTPGNNVKLSGLTGVTGGLGVNVGKFSLDYAMMPFGDLGMTQKVSVTVHFSK